MTPPETGRGDSKGGLTWPVFIVGASVLIMFGWFTWYVVHSINDSEVQWSRLFTTYQGIEALAVAALGAVLGGGVQQVRIRSVRRQLTKAESDATTASKNAERNAGASVAAQGMVNLLASAMTLGHATRAYESGEDVEVPVSSHLLGNVARGSRRSRSDATIEPTLVAPDSDAVIQLALEYAARSGFQPGT